MTDWLYRDVEGELTFRRVWETDEGVLRHEGQVGYPGTIEPCSDTLGKELRQAHDDGYRERAAADMTPLILRWTTAPAPRADVFGKVDQSMKQVGGGFVESADLHGTGLTVQCRSIEPRLVMARVVDRLQQEGWLYSVEIGVAQESGGYLVAYPPPYGRPFKP